MKVPNKVLKTIHMLANGVSVSPEDRAAVLEWATTGISKRDAAAVEAAQAKAAAKPQEE